MAISCRELSDGHSYDEETERRFDISAVGDRQSFVGAGQAEVEP
jgi:hypothetical protein